MTKAPIKTLDELMAEEEAARLAQADAERAKWDSPEEVAKRAARRQADHEKGVRLGWWDADGNPLATDEDEDDEELVEDELREGEED